MLTKKKVQAAAKRKREEDKASANAGAECGDQQGEEPEGESKPMEINMEDLDVLGVEDITDVGNGEPLFANFVYEDWALLSIRYEFHLLLHAFKKDLDDPERPSFSEDHFEFYYQKYFRKPFVLKNFSVGKLVDLADLIKDTVTIGENRFLRVERADDTPIATFVKYTEEHRRERERRMDAGDETAQLKFIRPTPGPPPNTAAAKANQQRGSLPSARQPDPSSANRPTTYKKVDPAPSGQKRPAFGGTPSNQKQVRM